MHFYLCIDDTDDKTKSVGTGEIASAVYEELKARGSSMVLWVTRHQLLLDPRIEYTSHNSSMCMEGDTDLSADEIWGIAGDTLMKMRSEISNPGICLYVPEDNEETRKVMDFGFRAKETVLCIDDAKKLADEIPGMRLEAPAGNGSGMIGALAGVGLRLSGNDGSFRGRGKKCSPGTMTVKELKESLGISDVYTKDMELIPDGETVRVGKKVKLIYRKYRAAAMCFLSDDGIYEVGNKAAVFEAVIGPSGHTVVNCEYFEWDNDRGEMWTDTERNCLNCLHRRLVKEGMRCTAKKDERHRNA